MDDKRQYDKETVDEITKVCDAFVNSDTDIPMETDDGEMAIEQVNVERCSGTSDYDSDEAARRTTVGKASKQKLGFDNLKSIIKNKKAQLVTAVLLTVTLLIGYPTYSWFKMQRSIERYEKISTPNSLYITAARREDSKYFEIDNVDVSAYWYNNGVPDSRVTYQDYVFSVAGDYVSSYTIQLAHTTNNNYMYELYEATVSDTRPSGILGKDYIEYTLTEKYDPVAMEEITANPVYANKHVGDKLYYSIKRADDGNTKVSLNGSGTTYQQPNIANVTASTYTVGGKTVSYRGHYLNWASQFAALGTGTYHNQTYGSNKTVGDGSGTDVQTHAEPLYWQANEIPVEGAVQRSAFYHEYILRISWTNGTGNTDATATYKDTDMIYISVKAD